MLPTPRTLIPSQRIARLVCQANRVVDPTPAGTDLLLAVTSVCDVSGKTLPERTALSRLTNPQQYSRKEPRTRVITAEGRALDLCLPEKWLGRKEVSRLRA